MRTAAFEFELGDDPLVATAIHAGHDLREDVASAMRLAEADRLREEDPYTDRWVHIAANRSVARRSRFEVDLNRPRDRSVYRTPADAWGLEVWDDEPSDHIVTPSLQIWDDYYRTLAARCDELIDAHGSVVVLDLHSYNHRRPGPERPAEDPIENPEINVGTAGVDVDVWRPVVHAFADTMAQPTAGGQLDVRFDVKFPGGHQVRWLRDRYGDRCCALAIEVKKIYMDEWTGVPDEPVIASIGERLAAAAAAARSAHAACPTP